MQKKIKRPTSFHWGSYYAETQDDNLLTLKPYELDRDPSNIANGLINSINDNLRIKFPHVRRGYLREIRRELSNSKLSLAGKRVRNKRGSDTFVKITWDEAIEIVAFELNRVKKKYKNKAFLLVHMDGDLLGDFITHKVNFIDFLIVLVVILNQ